MSRKLLVISLLVSAIGLGTIQSATAANPAPPSPERAWQPAYQVYAGTIYDPISPSQRVIAVRAVLVFDPGSNILYYRVFFPEMVAGAGDLELYLPDQGEDYVIMLYNGQDLDSHQSYAGSVTLTSTQADALTGGQYGLRVNGSPELTGQVTRYLIPYEFRNRLSGSAEAPPVNTTASGEYFLRLRRGLDYLDYQIEVADINSITLAHFHIGWPGESGAPVIPLYAPGDSRLFDPEHALVGEIKLSAGDVLNLLTGYYYLNIHTETNPAGEIRGQVQASFTAYLPVGARTDAAR